MQVRTGIPALRWVWIGGCIYATLLILVGVLEWGFLGAADPLGLLGYGIGAVPVLLFSRGVYNRSLVSGILLLGTALGPALQAGVQWSMGVPAFEASVSGVMDVTLLLTGLGLGALVLRALSRLHTEGALPSREGVA